MSERPYCIMPKHLRGDNPPVCFNHARWFVWYESCGNIYTTHCDKYLAEALLGDVEKVSHIAPIRRPGEPVNTREAPQ